MSWKRGVLQRRRQGDGHIGVLQGDGSVKSLPPSVAYLKEIAAGTKHGMLPKLVPNLGQRQRGDLALHEPGHAANPIPQLVVEGVIDTGLHGKPCRDAESAK